MASSERKAESNRRNASRSTGPKTADGKRIASRNAVKHGLSVRRAGDPAELGALSRAMAEASRDPGRLFIAGQAASATLELRRVHEAQEAMLAELARLAFSEDREGLAESVAALLRLQRYERRAASRQKSLLRRLQN